MSEHSLNHIEKIVVECSVLPALWDHKAVDVQTARDDELSEEVELDRNLEKDLMETFEGVGGYGDLAWLQFQIICIRFWRLQFGVLILVFVFVILL